MRRLDSVGPASSTWNRARLLATVAEFAVSQRTPALAPDGMTTGREDSIWFTENGADKIGTIDPVTHAISELPIGIPGISNARALPHCLGPRRQAVVHREQGADQIGMIDPTTDKITKQYGPLTANARSLESRPAPTTQSGSRNGLLTRSATIDISSGKITEYPIHDDRLGPRRNHARLRTATSGSPRAWETASRCSIRPSSHIHRTSAADCRRTALRHHRPVPAATSSSPNTPATRSAMYHIEQFSPCPRNSRFRPPAPSRPRSSSARTGTSGSPQSKTNQVAMLNPSTQASREFATPAPDPARSESRPPATDRSGSRS